MSRRFVFHMEVVVHDEEALSKASTERAAEDGLPESDWQTMRADCHDDLVMLLDPGGRMLHAGFEIEQSWAEEV